MKSNDESKCLIFGGLVMDYYYEIDRWPDRAQDAFINSESLRVGGCAVNMAVTVKNLGTEASVISGIGKDDVGRHLESYMIEHGLSTDMMWQTDEVSGKCLVFLEPDGERTFLTQKGAEGIFTEEMKEAAIASEAKVVGVTGYYLLDRNADIVMDCLESLHENGCRILFDPSPLVGDIDSELLRRVLKISYMITPNTVEAELIEKICRISELIVQGTVVIKKDGSRGGSVYFKTPDSEEIETFDYEAVKCKVADTTGAGDSFAGALLFGLLKDMDIREAVSLAVRCAAKTVEIEGPHGFWTLGDEE